MENDRNTTEVEKEQKRGKAMLALCIVVIVALIAVIFLLLSKKDDSEGTAETAAKRNVVVNAQNAEEAAEEMVNIDFAEPGYYIVNMATKWHFSKGDAISYDARVDNVAGNTNAVYFDVFLKDNEEEPIYRSPVIPVGNFLEGIALDQPLDVGTYDCVVVYHLVNEEQETISTLRVAIQIMVES